MTTQRATWNGETNPFDRSDKWLDVDVPAEGETEQSKREAALGPDAVEVAQRVRILANSEEFKAIQAFVAAQKLSRVNQQMLTVLTDSNKDEMNFIRGEYAAFALLEQVMQQVVEQGAEVLELIKQEKSDA